MTKRALAALLLGAAALPLGGPTQAAAVSTEQVVRNYADIAQAMYGDALRRAELLDGKIGDLLASPGQATLAAARDAWRAARVPYQQTEGFRFGNPAVDEWEGKVNAWPLDEGLIDYVDASFYGEASDENPLYRLDVVANPSLRIGPDTVDAGRITKELLAGELHEAMDVEKNVATGYHAVEFLLWGQDLNGTAAGAGTRPWTDYVTGEACTNGHCDRRRAYLAAASDLVLDDLREIVAAWGENGAARTALVGQDDREALAAILTGIGSLSYGELAGERMKLGLLLHDPEEEHDCFSDNTHNSHYYNQAGMMAIWTGRYDSGDGKGVAGPSVAELAAAAAPAAKADVDARMVDAEVRLGAIKQAADSGRMAYDQMLAEGNVEGNAMIQAAVDALVAQTRAVEEVVAALDLKIAVEGSDSLDNPAAVQ